jgi:hypothetical protein
VQASKGAGGAIPRGFAPQQKQDNSAQISQNAQTLGGLLGMMGQQKQDASGFGLSSGVPAISEAPSNDVLGGLALANNGMSYEPLPPAWLDTVKNGVSQGWQGLLSFFGGGAGA